MGVRVLLAEDQRLMRSGLATMIGLQPDMEIVGDTDNGRSAVELAQKLSPDIVLMDITMPGLNGIDATQQIAILDPAPKIIVLSLHSDQRHVTDALKAGASGYVVKDSPLDELILAIRAVCQGRVYLSPQVAGGVLHDYRRCVPGSASPDFATLSPREREVLQLIAEGKSTKAIASALYVSKKTIDTHRAHILTKLHASSVAELVKHAIREGLTSAEPEQGVDMTTAIYTPAIVRRETYLNASFSVKSWLLTIDHKRIAILYMLGITFFFLLGGFAAVLIRLELMTPAGDLVQAETYNKLFTMHGVLMVFFFLIPSIPAVFGNFLVPLMIGARDLAFPKLNLLSWYLFMIGGIITIGALLAGGVDTGWTFYTPYSSVYSNSYVVATIVGIFINGFSSILTGLNFIVTIHTMRAPGMTWGRMPLFLWSTYATSVIFVLGTPVIAITLLLVVIERVFGIGIFNPALGGDPILFQHMFWFYSHPAVYIMVLPAMGVVSEIVACFSHKCIYGYRQVAWASIAIAVLSFLVWGHHMFVTGQSVYGGLVFSFLSFMVAIPSAIKVFNWTATLYKGSVDLRTPMLYALGFIGLFTMGGLTGLFLASMAVDVHVTDTYFIVAHFHYIMVGGAVSAYLGAIHFWWPKMTGRMYPEWWGRFAAFILFIGFNFTFFPQFILGYLGMPRRYHAYAEEFQVLNVMSTAGASILAVGYLLPLCYLVWSLGYGEKASDNPFGAAGLEWKTPSPPPTLNFDKPPIVEDEAYAYEKIEVPYT